MKARHVDAYRQDARATLRQINISVGQDFLTLNVRQVESLLAEADRRHYRVAFVSDRLQTARHLHDLLQRRAK